MFEKIIRYFLCAALAAFLVWQGIFWMGEYMKIKKYSSVMDVVSFWDSVSYLSKKMPVIGILCRWYDYQDYVVREEQSGRVPKDWREWNNNLITRQLQTEEFLEKTYKELKARADAEKADIYGGETPEETWALFLDALKKEDFELASKYFVAKRQAQTFEWLKKIKNSGELSVMIDDLSNQLIKNGDVSNQTSYYLVTLDDDNKEAKIAVSFKKSSNNKWKIDSI